MSCLTSKKKQIHNLVMAVKKNRNYTAHGINTTYLHITFKIQLALLSELCNMSTPIPYKRHNLNSQLALIQSLNSVTSFCIEWLLSVQCTDQEDSGKGEIAGRKGGARGAGHTRDRVWKLTLRQGQLSGTSVLIAYSHLRRQNVPNPGTDCNSIITMG